MIETLINLWDNIVSGLDHEKVAIIRQKRLTKQFQQGKITLMEYEKKFKELNRKNYPHLV